MKYTLKGDTIGKVDFETNKLEYWLLQLGGSLQRRAQKQFREGGGRHQ